MSMNALRLSSSRLIVSFVTIGAIKVIALDQALLDLESVQPVVDAIKVAH
jgi:hypothetical protein